MKPVADIALSIVDLAKKMVECNSANLDALIAARIADLGAAKLRPLTEDMLNTTMRGAAGTKPSDQTAVSRTLFDCASTSSSSSSACHGVVAKPPANYPRRGAAASPKRKNGSQKPTTGTNEAPPSYAEKRVRFNVDERR